MATESLTDYLVKIGWDVGEKDWKRANELIKSFEANSLSGATLIAKAFSSSVGAVTHAVIGANKVLFNFLDTLADTDLQTERTARKFWAAEKSVRAYQTALDALDENESDLFYMTDEEYNRFLKLNALGKSLEAPKELDTFLVKIRDIQYEFSRLQVYFEYGKRWVAYWFSLMNSDNIDRIKNFLSNVNDWIYKNFPKITYYLAKILDIVFRLGRAGLAIVNVIIKAIGLIGSLLNNTFVKTTSLVAGFFLLLKSGPIGWIIASLTALLLLIDDYLTWKEGGISYFDWGAVEDKIENVKESFNGLKDNIGTVNESIDNLKRSVDKLFKPLLDWLDKVNAKQYILDAFKQLLDLIAQDFKNIASAIELVSGGFDRLADFVNTWRKLEQGIELYDGDNSDLGQGGKWAEKIYPIYKNTNDVLSGYTLPADLGYNIGQQILNFVINGSPGMSTGQLAKDIADVYKNIGYNSQFPG